MMNVFSSACRLRLSLPPAWFRTTGRRVSAASLSHEGAKKDTHEPAGREEGLQGAIHLRLEPARVGGRRRFDR